MEHLVTKETAKLAFDKGFEESCRVAFSLESDQVDTAYDYTGEEFFTIEDMYASKNNEDPYVLAPSQTSLQKWLREIHDIDVFTIPNEGLDNEKIYCSHIKQNNKYFIAPENGCIWQNQNSIPEKSLEEGLQQALKLIP